MKQIHEIVDESAVKIKQLETDVLELEKGYKYFEGIQDRLTQVRATQNEIQGKLTRIDNELIILRKRLDKHSDSYLAHEGRKG